MEDLRVARDFVRKNTGWDVPIDAMTIYAQMAKHRDYEVIMEEKRKSRMMRLALQRSIKQEKAKEKRDGRKSR